MAGTGDRSDIVLISMPFGPVRQPSLGLSLLKATLPRARVKILYLGLPFAEQVGPEFYLAIAEGTLAGTAMAGEWVFRRSLFPEEPERTRAYLEKVLPGELDRPLDAELRTSLLEARHVADEFLERCLESVLSLQPGVVGFTSVFQQQLASLALAKRIGEERPDLPIVFGGANCEGVMGREVARQFPFVDAVVSGEGEAVFPELVTRLLAGRDVDDLVGVYTAGNSAADRSPAAANAPRVSDLDALPYPDFGDFFEQWSASPMSAGWQPRLVFETSRGCWWGEKKHCTFCGLNGTSMAFRSKSAERALTELERMCDRYPGLSVMVVDNILDMKYFRDFLPALAERDLDASLFYEVKANLKKDQIRILREAGVNELQPGIESLSNEVLDLMGKGVTALQNIQLLKWCAQLGVFPNWNLIWGFPGEPESEYRRMSELVPFLSHLPPPRTFCKIRLDRFSPNFERSEELGFSEVLVHPAYDHLYPFAEETVRNLSYHFSHEYRDGRDVERYTRDLGLRLVEWQETYETSKLFSVERGDELWIWDLRPVARRSLWALSGIERSLYEACDRIRSLEWLAAKVGRSAGNGAARATVTDVLEPLLEGGLMVRDGDQVLSLALAAADADRTADSAQSRPTTH